ncbi:MAG: flagellin [Selenomonadaceae bacterium]|nr:flagellin [Selenomonadaceae bacterium]MBR4383510.1 flagellin [Selenomonadaceae bacterium]
MSTVVKNNIPAMLVLNTLNKNSNGLGKSLKKVSTGERLTSAEDDAASFGISERMRVRIRALEQATQNAENDNSLMQVAEAALSSTLEILRTLKERAINSANDSNTDDDRKNLQKEIDGLIDQIDDNALVTFNGKYLIDGTKNVQTRHIFNSFANESLGDNVGTDKLIDWTNKAGDSLEILSTDKITISTVWQGKAYVSQAYEIKEKTMSQILSEWDADRNNNTTSDIYGLKDGLRWTPNTSIYGKNGQGQEVPTPGDKLVEDVSPRPDPPQTDYNVPASDTLIALDHQFSSFNLSITDAQGNVRKIVNSFVDNFHEVIRAQNKSENNMLNFQIGSEANQSIRVGFSNMTAQGLALKGKDGTKIQVTTQKAANAAIGAFDTAISRVLDEQTKIGAVRTRLEYAVSNLSISNDNVMNSESTIRDADMAKEMMNYTRNNLLLQTSQSMLAQANQNPSAVLSLLQ